ncbi:hypothetical protein AVEN_256293-1 [Araneus ventricosus]|uniref:Uncharacterized protein n=1 Tax=Araneus ventricosus TaxID=182803 RepID=A0A4Y2TYJ7_ARAVE|nr:hypothetical protein AVEN_256293-1 [Araneus ventricosus]
MSGVQCNKCGSTNIGSNSISGCVVCFACGHVLDDCNMAEEVQFMQDSRGASRAVGRIVSFEGMRLFLVNFIYKSQPRASVPVSKESVSATSASVLMETESAQSIIPTLEFLDEGSSSKGSISSCEKTISKYFLNDQNLQSESKENSQQFNVRYSWQSQVPTGQPQRQLCRSYCLFIYNYKEKLVAQHSTRLRLPLSTNVNDIDPTEIEEKAIGWSAHPSEHLSPTQISLDDGGNINTGLRIYTDGSKTEKGVGAAFCVLTDVSITHRWSTRLSLRNMVFQAEILALLKAVEPTLALPTQQLTILVDNKASSKSKESQFNCPENLQVTP